MKKSKLIINILLLLIVIASVIALALICPLISDNLDAYSKILLMSENEFENKDVFLEALQSNATNKIISVIFSALAAIASAATLFLLNFKVWKEKKST